MSDDGSSGPQLLDLIPSVERQRMADQEPLIAAADVLSEAVEGGDSADDGYSGIALSDSAVELWWKGALPAGVRAAVAEARAIAPVVVRHARHSRAELQAASDRVIAAARETPNGPVHGASIPVDGSRLTIETDAVVAGRAAVARLGIGVEVEVKVTRRSRAASRSIDHAPVAGGAVIANQDTQTVCTSGFGVTDGTNSFLLTAGHCGRPGGYWKNGGNTIGAGWYEHVAHDLLLIGAPARGYVYTGGLNDMLGLDVAGYGKVYPGEYLCSSGAVSAPMSCGAETTNVVTHSYCGHDVYGAYECYQDLVSAFTGDRRIEHGDSGGPVFRVTPDGWVIAKGVISGFRTDGVAFSFQDFETVRRDFDVWPIFDADVSYTDNGGDYGGGGGGSMPPPPPLEHRADLNGNQIADLARFHGNGHLYVYPGRGGVEPGSAFWAPRDHGPEWGGTRSAALGDLNRDGVADLVRYTDDGHLYLYPGRGGSTGVEPGSAFWAPRDLGPDWGGTVSIALGDLNGDGIADLARVKDDGHLYVYPGRGGVEPDTAFWAPRDHGPDWGGTVSSALGDLNGDAIADLARAHGNGHLYVYPGRGGSGGVEPGAAFWAPRDHGPDWGATVSIALGDLNGDAIADLARAHGDGHLYVYPGRGGSGGVEPATAFWAPRDHGGDWGSTASIAL